MKKEKIIRVSVITSLLIGIALGLWGVAIVIKWLITQIICFIHSTNVLGDEFLIIIMAILGVIIFLDDIFHIFE